MISSPRLGCGCERSRLVAAWFWDACGRVLTFSQVQGRNLTEVINTTHKNERYLPDIKLPKNLVAVGNLKKVVEGASLIVFVVPHQL